MQHQHFSHHEAGYNGKIFTALVVILLFAGIEYVVGRMSGSLALVADAGHMVTDGVALLIALGASLLSARPSSAKFTYGFGRLKLLSSLINVILIFTVIMNIASDAFSRLENQVVVDIYQMAPVAALGLLVNIATFFILHSKDESMNMKAVRLHVMGDMLGSIGALIGAAVIYFTDWHIVDTGISLFLCFVLLSMGIRLSKDIIYQSVDGVPPNVSTEKVKAIILDSDPVVTDIHDLHIWQSCDKYISLTAHIDVKHMPDNWNEILYKLHRELKDDGIEHITIQPEILGGYCAIDNT